MAGAALGSRVADVLHKTFITGLTTLTAFGIYEVSREVNYLNTTREARREAGLAMLAAEKAKQEAAAAAE